MSKEGKYIIHASIRTDGTVARKDVIGAIFGQTEGLLGDELQLRKLQRTGRIGHVDVVLHQNKGQIQGEILVTSSLDQVSTAVIGAALETIERIGPCKSSIKVKQIENIKNSIQKHLETFQNLTEEEIVLQRKNKFLKIGRGKGFSSKSEINAGLSFQKDKIDIILEKLFKNKKTLFLAALAVFLLGITIYNL